MKANAVNLGRILKQQRISIPLTIQKLAALSGVSSSHLGRIERGDRFPSAHILRRLAKPLGFNEDELFTLAGFLSPVPETGETKGAGYGGKYLDPMVSKLLAEEPIEVQRAVLGILAVLKSIAKTMQRREPSA